MKQAVVGCTKLVWGSERRGRNNTFFFLLFSQISIFFGCNKACEDDSVTLFCKSEMKWNKNIGLRVRLSCMLI